MTNRTFDHALPDDDVPLVARPVCVGEPPESETAVRIVEPERSNALRTLVLSMVAASDARNVRNLVRDLDRAGTLGSDLPDRPAIDSYVRSLVGEGFLAETSRGIGVVRGAPDGKPDGVDPLDAVAPSMATSTVDAVMAAALFLHGVVELFATRTHDDGDGRWVSRTVAAPHSGDGPTFERAWYRIDPDGVLHVPHDRVHEPIETSVIDFSYGPGADRRRHDPFCAGAVDELVASRMFLSALRRVHPPTRRMPTRLGQPFDGRILELLRSVCVFSDMVGGAFPKHLRTAVVRLGAHSDAFRSGFPHGRPSGRHGGWLDLYHWLTPPDRSAAVRRLQAAGVAAHSLQYLVRSTARIDAGESVLAILVESVRCPLPPRGLGRILAAFPYPPAPDRETDVVPHPRRRREGTAQEWRKEVLGDVCDLCAEAGGTEILRHSERAVRRLAAWYPVALRPSGYPSGSGTPRGRDRYARLGVNFLRSAVRDPDGACDLIESGAFDFVADLRRRLGEAAELLPGRGPPWGREMPADRIVDLLVGPDSGLGRLRDASAGWHRAVDGISRTLEAMRTAVRSSTPPTRNPLVFPGGRIEWLTTPESLADEGRSLSHCVGSYADTVLAHGSYVGSVVASDGSRATVEMGRRRDGTGVPELLQFRSFRNGDPSRACRDVVDQLRLALSDGKTEWTDPPQRSLRPSSAFPAGTDPDAVVALYDPVLPRDLRGLGMRGWLGALDLASETKSA